MTFVHPLFASPSRLVPVRSPGTSRVYCTLLWYTAGVSQEPGAHDADPLRPLPAYAGAACYPGHVGDPRSHVPLSGDARHEVHAGSPHMTRRNPARCDGAVPPARPAGARFPMQRAGSSSEDQVWLENGQVETPVADGRGQR